MSTLVDKRVKAIRIDFNDEYLIVTLDDARILQIPLIWYPRLYNASDSQRRNYNWIGKGIGIEWQELDEHLSVHGFLTGQY